MALAQFPQGDQKSLGAVAGHEILERGRVLHLGLADGDDDVGRVEAQLGHELADVAGPGHALVQHGGFKSQQQEGRARRPP
jgi:hypothetical protein